MLLVGSSTRGWHGICDACKEVWSATLVFRGSDTGLFGSLAINVMPPPDVEVSVAVALSMAWAVFVWSFLDVVSPTLAPVLEPVVVETATSMISIVLYAWTSAAGMACALGCVSASGKKHRVQRVSLALVLMLASASMSGASLALDMRPSEPTLAPFTTSQQDFSYADPTASNGVGFQRDVVLPATVQQAVARFASGPVASVVRVSARTHRLM
jgi:hypothetical protein